MATIDMSLVQASARAERPPAVAAESRTVRRVVRRIDPWSVLKVSLLFNVCLLAAVLVAGVLLWMLGSTTGVIGNVETFIEELFALESFSFVGWQVLRAVLLGGLVIVLLNSALTVLMTVLYNVLSEVVGGIEVVETEPAAARPPVI